MRSGLVEEVMDSDAVLVEERIYEVYGNDDVAPSFTPGLLAGFGSKIVGGIVVSVVASLIVYGVTNHLIPYAVKKFKSKKEN